MKLIVAIMLMPLMALSATWTDPSTGISWSYTVSNGKATVTSGWSATPAISQSTTGAITIPETLGGFTVECVGNYAFYNCGGLTLVTIPAGVTSIGAWAFYGCAGVTSVTIPEGVTSIGYRSFSGCSGLTSVTIPAGVTSIGDSAFSGCSGLTTVSIPAGVTNICEFAFYTCSGLTSVSIPTSVTSIGPYVFSGCSGLTSVAIPEGVTSIEDSVFSGCVGLTSVTIPAGVTSIGDSAFSGCSGLTSVSIPTSVTSIGSSAFSGCAGLTSITIPAGVTSIGERVFYNCSRLASVMIPEGVTSIGDSAFYNCRGLTSVAIPDGVTSIWYAAFSGCAGLTSVTVPSSVTSIGTCAFSGCSGLTRVSIIDLEKWFGISFGDASANPLFYAHHLYLGDEEVKNLIIPSGVMRIESYAFSGCSGLISVTIPDGVTSIGSVAFYGCSGLKSVTIPEGVTSIERDAFSGCSGLMSVRIPSSVSSFGYGAFSSCNGLQSVEFLGPPPNGLSNSGLLSSYSKTVFPREYGAQWMEIRGINSFAGYGRGEKPVVEIVSSAIRENDPTVMDVVYKVKSVRSPVKVRALAFQDGERGFAKVVRPTEFVEDTAKNIGDAMTANEEHKLSWRVSADWKVDLAKVKFEVLASDGDLLPLELTTIPKVGNHAAMELSWNAITEQQVLDALLWCYADGDAGLTLSNGVLKNGAVQLVDTTSLSSVNAIKYVYKKMGFSVLSGEALKYANDMMRIGLQPSGVRQYAYRVEKDDGTWGPADECDGYDDPYDDSSYVPPTPD